MRIARQALPFLLPPLLLSAVAAALGFAIAAVLLLLLALFVTWFFRDPDRAFAGPSELLVAAADGRVTRIDRIEDPDVAAGESRRIVTFLSAFNVHVQRSPCEGEVVHSRYVSGRKVAAFRADADLVNENQLTVLRRDEGELIGVRQIAGLVARRVVPYLAKGDTVVRGERLGIIKFGSRVDLIVPPHYEILVSVGDRLSAGSTPVAMPTDPSSPPPGGDS